jgi:hypothetical protein
MDIDPQSSDLLYRINRKVRSQSGVEELAINRLMTWSAGRFEVQIRALLPEEIGQQGAGQLAHAERHACLLELDINTVPEPQDRILPREDLPRIFDELVALGVEIATRGDYRL